MSRETSSHRNIGQICRHKYALYDCDSRTEWSTIRWQFYFYFIITFQFWKTILSITAKFNFWNQLMKDAYVIICTGLPDIYLFYLDLLLPVLKRKLLFASLIWVEFTQRFFAFSEITSKLSFCNIGLFKNWRMLKSRYLEIAFLRPSCRHQSDLHT